MLGRFDYCRSALNRHKLYQKCNYHPTPIPINTLEIEMPPRKKSKEYTDATLKELLTPHLKRAFEVHNDSDFKIKLTKQDRYFFIKVNPMLDQVFWIFIYHNPHTKKLYLFDPQGLPLERFLPSWLPELRTTEICICHSWFVYPTYPNDPEHEQTGLICVELAKSLAQGLQIETETIEDNIATPDSWSAIGTKISHFNLVLPAAPHLSALATLLMHFPSRVSSQAYEDRHTALSTIAESQSVKKEPLPPFDPSFFPATTAEESKAKKIDKKREADDLRTEPKIVRVPTSTPKQVAKSTPSQPSDVAPPILGLQFNIFNSQGLPHFTATEAEGLIKSIIGSTIP